MTDVGLMTVTEVRMSPDLRLAKVYVSIFGDRARKERTLTQLEDEKSSIRSIVGKAVRLRFTPDVAFVLDETMDEAMKLEGIFKKIREEEGRRERKDGGNGSE
jgi:ribosome-binding factor A